MKTIPHLNLSSYPGGGKTTVTKLLLETYSVVLIPKFTTRPQRPVEDIPEYIFIDKEEFLYRESDGQFIAKEAIQRHGETYHHAIPKIQYWPKIPTGTELILSVFGVHAPYAKKFMPNMKLCFIDFENKDILMKRLYDRCILDNSDFEEKKRVVEGYITDDIKSNYDHIIYNDGTIHETLEKIRRLVRLPQRIFI